MSAGRGFAAEEDLQKARDLAAKLGGAIACSRPLTEGVNWLPTELYVGVSGITVTPKLYIAAGISGQMQHMVGANRSATVIAVNKDKNAPIFKQCDFGIVGDLNGDPACADRSSVAGSESPSFMGGLLLDAARAPGVLSGRGYRCRASAMRSIVSGPEAPGARADHRSIRCCSGSTKTRTR